MDSTPLSEQIRIVIFGFRNSGKSSLLNRIFEKEVAIVSDVPGTTTDPVTRSMELLPLGPVAFTDTAGVDDEGDLGKLRIDKSVERLKQADILVFVTSHARSMDDNEKRLFEEAAALKKPLVVACTFFDMAENNGKKEFYNNYRRIDVDNISGKGVDNLKKALIDIGKTIEIEMSPVDGIVDENDMVVLVTPIDLAAPKGRLILPQVETIRALLDRDCGVVITKERELYHCYNNLKTPPRLVITDSQVFSKVAADIPETQLLTSFSILFARKKGELAFFTESIAKIGTLLPEKKVLVLEACSHHRQADDIGTVKIPRLYMQLVNPHAQFEFRKGLPEKEELSEYGLIIHCGGCMLTRNRMMSRIRVFKEMGIPAVNYGLFLAYVNGLLPRALEPFPYEHTLYCDLAGK